MNRQITVNKQAMTLTANDLLGVGGEAEVYRHQQLAIKLYHDIDTMTQLNPGVSRAALSARQKEKRQKIKSLPGSLPSNVVSPSALAYRGSHFAGYAMPLIENAYDFRLLAKRSFREGSIGNAAVASLLLTLQQTLEALHALNVVIGDLNDNNVLFRDREIFFIDIDSMQFGGYLCPVGSERFLDPLLYGVDLTQTKAYSPASDYYAVAVLLLQSWLFVGPYGGRHPSLRTWLRRAEQRVSIFSKDVTYPKAAVPYDILPDELLQFFFDTFEKDVRKPIPVDIIESLPWTCCSCGLEHARSVCPCRKQYGQVVESTLVNRSVKVTTLFKTSGRIHAYQVCGDKLLYLYQQNNIFYRENGEMVFQGPLSAGMRFALTRTATWIARGNQVIKIEVGNIAERRQTATWMNQPVIATIGNDLVYIDGETLRIGERRIRRILNAQTWIASGNEFGFGFYRVGALVVYFLFETKNSHIRELSLPLVKIILRDIQCHFSDSHVLVMLSEERNGAIMRHALLIRRKDGYLEAMNSGNGDDSRLLESSGGKVVNGHFVVSAAEDGLALFAPDRGKLVEIKRFQDTEAFINPEAVLLPAPDGGIYQISTREILRINLLD